LSIYIWNTKYQTELKNRE